MGVVLFLLILVGFALFVYRPQLQKLSGLKNEKGKKEMEIKAAHLTLQQLKEIKKERAQILAKLAQFSVRMPPSPEFPSLLREFQKIANEAGIDFLSIKPSLQVQQPEYAELPLELTIEGFYKESNSSLIDFLYRVQTLSREIKVSGVNISEGKGGLPHLKMVIKTSAFIFQKEATKKPGPEALKSAPPTGGD